MNNKSEWNIVSRIKKIKNISNNNIIINDKNTLIMQDPVNYINFKQIYKSKNNSISSHSYEFNDIIENEDNEEIYSLIRPLIEDLFFTGNSTVFCFGGVFFYFIFYIINRVKWVKVILYQVMVKIQVYFKDL